MYTHLVESCQIGANANISTVLESAKFMWNAMIPLLDAPNNKNAVIKPLTYVHTCLKYVRDADDPDFLVLIY